MQCQTLTIHPHRNGKRFQLTVLSDMPHGIFNQGAACVAVPCLVCQSVRLSVEGNNNKSDSHEFQ